MNPINESSNISLLTLPTKPQSLILSSLPLKDAFVTWRKVSASFKKALEDNVSQDEGLRKRFNCWQLYILLANSKSGVVLGKFNNQNVPEGISDDISGPLANQLLQFKLKEDKQGIWKLATMTSAVSFALRQEVLELTVNEFNRDSIDRVNLAKPSDELLHILQNNKRPRLRGRFNEKGIPENLNTMPSLYTETIFQFDLKENEQGLWEIAKINPDRKFTLEQQAVLKLTLNGFNTESIKQAKSAEFSSVLYNLLSTTHEDLMSGRFNEDGSIEDISHIIDESGFRQFSTDKDSQFQLTKVRQGVWEITSKNSRLTLKQRKIVELTLEKFNHDLTEKANVTKPSEWLLSLLSSNRRNSLIGRFNEEDIPENLNSMPLPQAEAIFQFKLIENEQGLWRVDETNPDIRLTLEQQSTLTLTLDSFNEDSLEQAKSAEPSDALLVFLLNNKRNYLRGRFNEEGIPENLNSMPLPQAEAIFQFELKENKQGLWEIAKINPVKRFNLEQRTILKLTLDKFNKVSMEQAERLAKPSDKLFSFLLNNRNGFLIGRFNKEGMPEDLINIPWAQAEAIFQFDLKENEQGLWEIAKISPIVSSTLEQQAVLKLTLDRFNTESMEKAKSAKLSDVLYNLLSTTHEDLMFGRFNEDNSIEDISHIIDESSFNQFSGYKDSQFQLAKVRQGVWEITSKNSRLTLKQRKIVELTLEKFNHDLTEKANVTKPSEWLLSLLSSNRRNSLIGRFNEDGIPENLNRMSSTQAKAIFQFKLIENEQGIWELVETNPARRLTLQQRTILTLTLKKFNEASRKQAESAQPSERLLSLLSSNPSCYLTGRFNEEGIPENLNSMLATQTGAIFQFGLKENEQGIWELVETNPARRLTQQQRAILTLTLKKFNKASRKQAESAESSDELLSLLSSNRSHSLTGRFDDSIPKDLGNMPTGQAEAIFQFKLKENERGFWKLAETNPAKRLTLKQRTILKLTLDDFNEQIQNNRTKRQRIDREGPPSQNSFCTIS